jgi:hypothetical protein
MTFPTGTQINTSNLDSADDDPSLARVDLLALVQAVNQLIASANLASGVAVLGGTGRIAGSQLPSTINPTGNLILQPSTGMVNIRNALRLYQIYSDDLGSVTGTASPEAGDMIYLVDGDAGTPCLAVYDGSNWRVVRLMTSVGDVGATVSGIFGLTCSADIV